MSIKALAHWLSGKGNRPLDRSPPPDFQPPFAGLQNKANFPPSLPLYRFQRGKQSDLTFARSKHYWALAVKATPNITELLRYARGASIILPSEGASEAVLLLLPAFYGWGRGRREMKPLGQNLCYLLGELGCEPWGLTKVFLPRPSDSALAY